MQSVFMAIRSFLMISCMIVVPVLAIFGTDWLKDFGIFTTGSSPRRSANTAAARRARTGGSDRALSEAKVQAVPAAPGVGQTPAAQPAMGPTALAMPEPQEAPPVAVPAWPATGAAPDPNQPVQANFETPIQASPVSAAPQRQIVPVKRQEVAGRPAASGPCPADRTIGLIGPSAVCVSWALPIICWRRGAETANSIASIAKWRLPATPIIRGISRRPITTPRGPCSRC